MIIPEDQLAALISTRLQQLLDGFLPPQTIHNVIRALEPDVVKWMREMLDERSKH
jgi:hypothetical protein